MAESMTGLVIISLIFTVVWAIMPFFVISINNKLKKIIDLLDKNTVLELTKKI